MSWDNILFLVRVLILAQLTEESYFDSCFETHEQLVQALFALGYIMEERIEDVMLKVDRKLYMPKSDYEDMPRIGPKNEDFLPPNMQAYALDNLKDQLKSRSKVLDVACGSGCLSACMAYMVGRDGLVVGQLNDTEELINASRNVKINNPELLEEGRIKFIAGDWELGHPEDGPYDAIHIGQIVEDVPEALLEQLKAGGRLMVPIMGAEKYKVFLYDKHKNGTVEKRLLHTLPYDEGEPI